MIELITTYLRALHVSLSFYLLHLTTMFTFVKVALRRAGSRQFSQRVGRPRPGALSYLHVPGSAPLLGCTIGDVLDKITIDHGDKEAVSSIHQSICKTFEEARIEAEDLAEGLLSLGLEKGDRVGIWSYNNYEWYITHNAVAKAGLVLVSINPAYQGPEVLYAINRVGIKCMVMASSFKTQNYYDILTSVIPEIRDSDPGKISSPAAPTLKFIIKYPKTSQRGTYSLEEIQFRGSKSRDRLKAGKGVAMTQGTTGQPKGVMLSHHSLVNNSYISAQRLGITHKDHICLTVPLFHCYGSVIGLIHHLNTGARLVMPAPSFDPVRSIQAVATEKCTVLYGTPTMHVDMMRIVGQGDVDISSLQIVLTAGASAAPALCKQMKEVYQVAGIASAYGMTETSPLSFQSLIEDGDEERNHTIGYPMEHTEVKVVDSDGNIVPVGVEGEMCVRGYTTMLGYWDEPIKTAETIEPSKWLHTGDIMALLENGYGRIVGRLSDMLIRGGENIYPREIEGFLHTCPKIAEAHVFGVSDYRLGEEVAVWVRLNQGASMTELELREFCKGKIAHFKIPKYISFREDFPKTASGKIQKFKMREIEEARRSMKLEKQKRFNF